MASHLCVDLYRHRSFLPGVSDGQRELPAGAFYSARYSWRVAHGALLLFLWAQAGGPRGLQPAAEAGLYLGAWVGRVVGTHRNRGMEAGPVFLAGLDDGRLSMGAHLAFCGDVGNSVLSSRAPHNGRAARLE